MRDAAFRREQWEERYAEHVAPINRYVDEMREVGRGWAPYIAPIHGGVKARVLSILRDPGPATQENGGSGFICVENDDPSAELQCELLESAGLTAADLTPWNAYPWYINRVPDAGELQAGIETIVEVAAMMPKLRVILLQGKDAEAAWRRVVRSHPRLSKERELAVVSTYHPSRQALFHPDPAERQRRVDRRAAAFREVAEILAR